MRNFYSIKILILFYAAISAALFADEHQLDEGDSAFEKRYKSLSNAPIRMA